MNLTANHIWKVIKIAIADYGGDYYVFWFENYRGNYAEVKELVRRYLFITDDFYEKSEKSKIEESQILARIRVRACTYN